MGPGGHHSQKLERLNYSPAQADKYYRRRETRKSSLFIRAINSWSKTGELNTDVQRSVNHLVRYQETVDKNVTELGPLQVQVLSSLQLAIK